MGVSAAGQLVCGAVLNVVGRRGGKPGERDQAAGADPDVCARETYGRKLLSQLLIALGQLFGVLPHR